MEISQQPDNDGHSLIHFISAARQAGKLMLQGFAASNVGEGELRQYASWPHKPAAPLPRPELVTIPDYVPDTM